MKEVWARPKATLPFLQHLKTKLGQTPGSCWVSGTEDSGVKAWPGQPAGRHRQGLFLSSGIQSSSRKPRELWCGLFLRAG